MKRRLLSVGVTCVILGVAAAPGGAARYVLVDDGWGYNCYDTYANGASEFAPLSGGLAVRGLQADLARTIQFADDGRSAVWADASGLRLADLLSGRTVLLGRLVRRAQGTYSLGPGARTVLLANALGRGPHLVLVTRRRGRLVRRPIPDADGIRAEVSEDGRHLTYTGARGAAVRAVAGGPARWFGTAVTWWSVAGDRLAYIEQGDLHVLDLRTGAQILDQPVPDSPDFALPEGSWSPDGRYVLLRGDAVADVRAGRIDPLPAFETFDVAWRPGGGHQLLRVGIANAADLVDAATGKELWRRDGVDALTWSGDGQWLLGGGVLLGHQGRPVEPSPAAAGSVAWLGTNMLATVRARALRVAGPPRWRWRLVTRGAPGHHLSARATFSATAAGLRLLARTFRARAHARDCR